IGDFPEKRKEFSDAQVRHFNRLILEALFPGAVRTFRKRSGPDCILNYLTHGDYVGEMGVLNKAPRGATCAAHGHQVGTTKEPGQVELVRIPGHLIQQLVQSTPGMRKQLEATSARRQEALEKIADRHVYEENAEVQFSQEFEALGL